jgi:hypothetical protein
MMVTKANVPVLLLFVGLLSLLPSGNGVAGTLQEVKARGKLGRYHKK